ncbi:MAG: BamA/TamA family outer membrane protein [Chitinophagales bacterium]|nr:BamA/TamA family outer membrane protein [Chitinophagales bacterium]
MELNSKLFPKQTKDSIGVNRLLSEFLGRLREAGYTSASIDSFFFAQETIHTYIFIGTKQSVLFLQNGNVQASQLVPLGLSHYFEKNRRTPINDLPRIKDVVVKNLEETGYPFAECYLDSFDIQPESFAAKLYVEPHDKFVFDTVALKLQTKLRRVFIKNYLGIKAGKPYKESLVKKVESRLNLLTFAEQTQPPTVSFQNGKAKVNVFLKDRKANQFDLLVGFLPGGAGQKLLITGQAQLHLVSPFGMGEEFRVKWEKLQPKTQTLDVHLNYPYLLGLPIGINARFQLYKKDTSFLNIGGDYGIQYQMPGSDYLRLSYRQQSTIVVNVDTNFIKANRTLPPVLDVNSNQIAIEFYQQRLNYRFNPTNGYSLALSAAFGLKNIKKNNVVASLFDSQEGKSYGYLYDSIQLKSFVMHLSIAVDKYWKISKRQTIRTNLEAKYIFNNRITESELFQIGGTTSLRGFDDRSIFTPYYIMLNAEYRYLLSKNAFFFLFVNSAMVKENRPMRNQQFDFPYGFGAGAAIETKIGMFALSYALGARQDEKITFKSSKIHVGYINYF